MRGSSENWVERKVERFIYAASIRVSKVNLKGGFVRMKNVENPEIIARCLSEQEKLSEAIKICFNALKLSEWDKRVLEKLEEYARKLPIYYIDNYYPVRYRRNNSWSWTLLDFKSKGNEKVIKYLVKVLDPKLPKGEDIAVANVPSHSSSDLFPPIRLLAVYLADYNRVNATSCLVRYRNIEKLSKGGSRNFENHLCSIRIDDRELIEGRKVLLIDDVATTGNSLRACASLLLAHGAVGVACIALGKTIERGINNGRSSSNCFTPAERHR